MESNAIDQPWVSDDESRNTSEISWTNLDDKETDSQTLLVKSLYTFSFFRIIRIQLNRWTISGFMYEVFNTQTLHTLTSLSLEQISTMTRVDFDGRERISVALTM